jgi:hypothetical protein
MRVRQCHSPGTEGSLPPPLLAGKGLRLAGLVVLLGACGSAGGEATTGGVPGRGGAETGGSSGAGTGGAATGDRTSGGSGGIFATGGASTGRDGGPTPVDTPTVLDLVATLALGSAGAQSALATAGDISPSGDSIILRTYTAIWLWCRASTWASTLGAAPVELPSASEPQSEGLTFSADGTAWYSAGETATTIHQAKSSCSP